MNGKFLFIFVAAVAFFTLAATYRFHDSAHTIGMIKKGGGTVRHPPLFDKNRDSYMLIATAGVSPPYRGNARVVLEGDPTLKATFHNAEPVVDLGIHRHPRFSENTYVDLRPKDRIALWVKITRDRSPARQQSTSRPPLPAKEEAATLCQQCDPADREAGAMKPGTGGNETSAVDAPPKPREDWQSGKGEGSGENGTRATALGAGRKPRGKGAGAIPVKGPALAFYDTVTNESLLRIPLRFKAGGGNDDQ